MKITYDKQADALYIKFNNNAITDTISEKPGIILDYDKEENIVGVEVLNASQKMEKPSKVEYEVVLVSPTPLAHPLAQFLKNTRNGIE